MADPEVAPETPPSDAAVSAEVTQPYVGRWNRLISTTNWEKGQIICQWREAMMLGGAPVTEYSDEAWAQLVGGVTSQHVGRLRRVFQRFGDVFDQYEGLFWSHFQAALDWDDAEMWLEGSLRNDWSVSQMRGKRWETLGTPPEQQQAAVAEEVAEAATEAAAEDSVELAAEKDDTPSGEKTTAESTTTTVQPLGEKASSKDGRETVDDLPAEAAPKRARLNVDVESLPDDVAEAFESFKLAIIAHRHEGWRDTTPESVVECLDALKQLALAD